MLDFLLAKYTSEASIRYKDEEQLLVNAENADEIYIQKILPKKMKCNLKSLEEFSFFNELKIIIRTVFAVIKRGSIEIDDNRRRSIEVN
jgi:lipopolysaccharide/colanic/teichoic acid biosynthesis glycosyltransferase